MALKRTRLKPVSAKRAEALERRRDAIMAVNRRSGGWCEACDLIEHGGYQRPARGDHRATDGHEPWTRGRGGPIDDPALIVAVCRAAHDWIHGHPVEATGLGLLGYERP